MFKPQIALVGLGYVGLPVAIAFNKAGIPTIGFDVNQTKIEELKKHVDRTGEMSSAELKEAKTITYTANPKDLKKANFIIVAVPTPITKANAPDLSLLESASRLVGQNLAKGSYVVFESTVYPGVTEDVCGPIIEKESGLKSGKDFFLGYSPERINPGDKEHTLAKIVKVVAGQTTSATKVIAATYEIVCHAGVHIAPTIKTAEAAKVIENTQRDLNIALMNELSLIFHRMNIDTHAVLEAAGTKWNFLKFTPGLVGGHCIGVDPYYLVHKAQELGHHPQVIAAGRRVNDSMAQFVAEQVIEGLIQTHKNICESKVLVMGLTFKENVNDMRNSKIKDAITHLQKLGVTVIGYDPYLTKSEIKSEFGIPSINKLTDIYDAIIIATPHTVFKKTIPRLFPPSKRNLVIFDIKRIVPKLQNHSGIIYKSL